MAAGKEKNGIPDAVGGQADQGDAEGVADDGVCVDSTSQKLRFDGILAGDPDDPGLFAGIYIG